MSPIDEDPPRPDDDPPGGDARAEALGRAIKVIRTGLGLGRPELAERAGLSYSYLAEIENGKKQASSAALHAIAIALAMSPSELLAASEEWAARLAGDELSTTRFEGMPRELASPLLDADRTFESRPAARGEARQLGARERALRWFRDDTATRVWNRSGIEPSSSGKGRRRTARSSKDAELEATLDRLRELMRHLSSEDRERVLDLARRLAEG